VHGPGRGASNGRRHPRKQQPDSFTVSRDEAPVIFEPGSKFAYSNPGMALLSYAVTAALKQAEHTDIRTLLRQRIMKPIGVKDSDWSIGYGKTFEVNGLNLVANWGGGGYTARAVARVGRLMLRKGNWQGRQLVDSRWVEEVVKFAGPPYPPSAVIKKIAWAPADEIIRKASGSDNWPINLQKSVDRMILCR